MATGISRAIGLGLTDAEMWTMTPAEIFEAIAARAQENTDNLRFFDTLNARFRALYAAAHGVKNATPADYLLLPPEPEEESDVPVKGDSPEVILMKLNLLTASMGGRMNVHG
jgi:hypothetical protein